ncbi:LacI family DNA-binding transcriptional regulator [Pasteurellaceae bacterium 20609_3]|uniref:LacI family DNA-binding transcriptional regulator n=1 Tax=Spirabiliibacterium mucosae TaxID=28156 RepID=UPI001AAC9085|nr:LacI family DNA-binding transcriptional regulator [Spirabiliibacterium mucosae]MBE2899179.1 LacI family DNA-binding transcriptional regulator [Spirabiliibacterium mucosae]
MSKKRLTLNDIARLAGVSKTTASIVLNGHSAKFRIKAETRDKVLHIARAHNYTANVYAKALQAQRSNTIGMVIPDFANLGFAATCTHLEQLCHEHGLQLLIACAHEQTELEDQAIERLLERQIDLLITTPSQPSMQRYARAQFDVPVLQLDRATGDGAFPAVLTDDASAVTELVTQLAKPLGISEFAYLGGQPHLRPSVERFNGFQQGLIEAGIALKSQWVVHSAYQAESAFNAISALYATHQRLPQALFTGSYAILEGVLRFLKQHHWLDRIGERFHLASFDDYSLLDCLPYPIHTIRQNHRAIATALFDSIQLSLKGETPTNKIIPADIIWR